ncbi:hepatocellular carcinoma-associated antigen 59-domain-containing protein [Mycena pura]|uniref:Hepatocellular carcinoma-associated antigen 59-domain-containing protein n=1 Tax=Mycena pura TaxID=153505 RepID=A0AAD7E4Y4_9AGAR|nr:hepatocellular carcinoma-associated antigen 59-domain-containing protein [Mycena pura]
MIKKRTRPQQRVRESPDEDVAPLETEEGEGDACVLNHPGAFVVLMTGSSLNLNDLIELRKLRQARQGIDAVRLNKGDARKRKRPREKQEAEQGGLRKGTHEDEDDEEDIDTRARRAVRSNNFTQQTNALHVDKHMMAYIEENLKVRGKARDADEAKAGPADPQEALYAIADRWNVEKQKPTPDDGNVTNSMAMLTAIPEVDLGMDARLKNIEETEKAKRAVAEGRQEPRNKVNPEEAHLVASRFYRPNLKTKSDASVLRDAKLEAMGLPVPEEQPRRNDGAQMATDELVMERFKKRMRK